MQGAPAATSPGPDWVRPGFLVAAAFASLAALAVLCGPEPAALAPLCVPFAVLALRFFELARFRLVHRSGWLLLLVPWTALSVVAEHSLETQWIWRVPAAVVAIGLLVFLFVKQRSLQLALRKSGQQRPDQDGEDWALGGLLALVFLLHVARVVALFLEPQRPEHWLLGLCALPLLWLQLTRSRRFPDLAGLFWILAVGVEVVRCLDGSVLWIRPVNALVLCCVLWIYLISGRVRRTFAGPAEAGAVAA